MKYPSFPPHTRNAQLFEGLIEDIVTTEENIEPSGMDRRSLAIGEACLRISRGQEPLESPKRFVVSENDKRGTNSILSTLHDMILSTDDLNQAVYRQKMLHMQVVRSLHQGIEYYSHREAGFLPERVALGMLTRYAHPDMLAFPALQHHEMSKDVSSHYDIGVVIRNPDDTIDAHHLQIKSDCFGHEGHPEPSKYFDKYLQKYRPFVQLVSGCCHLDMRGGRPGKVALAELLIKEAGDRASTQEIKYLDNITDGLVFAMTTDQLPRGEAVPNGLCDLHHEAISIVS